MKNIKNWRVNLIFIFILIFGAAIISRLFFLQIMNHKLYQAQALGQQTGFSKVQGVRGEIFFENSQENKGVKGSGEIKSLAINKEEWTVSATPNEINDESYFAETLAQTLGDATKEQMLSKLESSDSYVVIKKDLSADELEKFKALNLEGLHWQNEPGRYYPQERLASQLSGFVGGDVTGQYGVEGYYEDTLKGKTGIKEEKKGLSSIFFDDSQESLDGADIYLTIDYNIQFQAESLLSKAIEDLGADSGQIIVMKPDSGRVLAMANFPSFNPNQYSKEKNLDIFQNTAVQKLYEPGSVMKPFTMSIALNEGKITPDTTFVDEGFVTIGPDTIRNFDKKKYGLQTMTQVLENSVNTGAVFVSQLIPRDIYLDYFDKFGFAKKTGIDLQAEAYSRNENLKKGINMEFATASFGQGIELTPIQLASGFCALANGGKLVRPYVVEKIIDGSDEIYAKPQLSSQIISQQTISQLTPMLVSVVEKGFGSGAKIQGYYLAGKTGTAQIPLKNAKGYDPNKTIQSFIGFGPAFNPQFLILVKMDNPKVSSSSLSAVPVFKKLAQYIINYWQIPPDYDASKK